MADTNPLLPLNGKDVTITIYLDGTPVPGNDVAKTVDLAEVVTQFRDAYLGRDEPRVDEQTDGYDLNLEFDYTGIEMVQQIIAQKELRRQRRPFKQISIGMVLQARDGSFHGIILGPCTSKINVGFRGLKERGMTKLAIQGEKLTLKTL